LKKTSAIVFILLLLLASSLSFSQSRETGAITGKAVDEQGAPLPGVGLTLSGEKLMGTRSTVSDTNGDFRFPALPPGTYSLKAELGGFGTVVQENIRLTTTATLALTITLKPSTVQEQITVIAESPTVDVKSTETASVTLSSEILRNIPNSQFTSDIVNLAPGVNNDSAYGAAAGRGISYQMDGVGVGDPDGGTAWVFLDYNIVEEAKVMGVGLPAEYGNFTGVIFNIVTRSGGNKFSGHFEAIYQGSEKGFWGTDNNAAYAEDWPDITPPHREPVRHQRPPRRPHRQGQALVLRGGPVLQLQELGHGLPLCPGLQAAALLFQAELAALAQDQPQRGGRV
jgi:hypothetical protein